jgi:hypothetical protein
MVLKGDFGQPHLTIRRLRQVSFRDVNDEDADLWAVVAFIVLKRGDLSEPPSMLAEQLYEAGLRLGRWAADLRKHILTDIYADGLVIIGHEKRN